MLYRNSISPVYLSRTTDFERKLQYVGEVLGSLTKRPPGTITEEMESFVWAVIWVPNALPYKPRFSSDSISLSQCISVWNSYSTLPLVAEKKEFHYPELESPGGNQEQRWPEEAHYEEKKKTSRRIFFSNCTQLLNIRGAVFFIFIFCFVFWHVARYNREKQLHQKYQRDCFQVNWKSYKSHSLFNLCDTAAQDALVVAQDTGQRSEKSGLFQPNRAVGSCTRRC